MIDGDSKDKKTAESKLSPPAWNEGPGEEGEVGISWRITFLDGLRWSTGVKKQATMPDSSPARRLSFPVWSKHPHLGK